MTWAYVSAVVGDSVAQDATPDYFTGVNEVVAQKGPRASVVYLSRLAVSSSSVSEVA